MFVLVMGAATLLLVACGEKENTNNIITRKPVKVVRKSTQRVGDYAQSRVVDWHGSVFTVSVERKADTSLPLVDDGMGNNYYDNRVSVRVTGKDGRDVFSRVFTKADFGKYVDSEYVSRSALLGVVFDRVEGDCIYFAASVGSPDKMSDDYVPLVVRLAYGGKQPTIYKDTVLDTGNGEVPGDGLEQYEEDGV